MYDWQSFEVFLISQKFVLLLCFIFYTFKILCLVLAAWLLANDLTDLGHRGRPKIPVRYQMAHYSLDPNFLSDPDSLSTRSSDGDAKNRNPLNDQERLELEKSSFEKLKKKIRKKRFILFCMEEELKNKREYLEDQKKTLEETDLEHEHQMIAEFAVISEEEERLETEEKELLKEKVKYESYKIFCELKPDPFELGLETISKMMKTSNELQQSFISLGI